MKKTRLWRFLEILPGALAWIGIIMPILLAGIFPSAVAIYVVLFDLFWIVNALMMAMFMFMTFKKNESCSTYGLRREAGCIAEG